MYFMYSYPPHNILQKLYNLRYLYISTLYATLYLISQNNVTDFHNNPFD